MQARAGTLFSLKTTTAPCNAFLLLLRVALLPSGASESCSSA
uniref:Uncharacterized protein n=1 Tax=Siphoviridae sp. ctGO42 TaxID=2827566 RepID=A0A8S5LIT1_9CAUD|nr:MAG TPA: hypothetical protein [Siphoviridae sp. ctGO42]